MAIIIEGSISLYSKILKVVITNLYQYKFISQQCYNNDKKRNHQNNDFATSDEERLRRSRRLIG